MSFIFIGGAVICAGIIIAAGIWSGRMVRSEEDFSTGGDVGSAVLIGSLCGTMVGGSATIGTAQLAYMFGFSAWWYSLGTAIGLVLTLFVFSDKFRKTGQTTFSGIIGEKFGKAARAISAFCNLVGCSLIVLSQLYSGSAVVAMLLPGAKGVWLVLPVAILILLYIVFGGVKSMGIVGTVKVLILLPTTLFCGLLALKKAGTPAALFATLPKEQYMNLFARGVTIDAGAGFSSFIGTVTSQAFLTSILSARSDKTARKGLLATSFIAPLTGICGVLVGVYMRGLASAEVLMDTEQLARAAKTALPDFILNNCPPFLSGFMLCALLIGVVGTGANQALSVSNVLRKDIMPIFSNKFLKGKNALFFSKASILILLVILTCCTQIGSSIILDISILSLGLRASALCFPIVAALFIHRNAEKGKMAAAIAGGPAAVIIIKMLRLPVDATVAGVIVSGLLTALALVLEDRSPLS